MVDDTEVDDSDLFQDLPIATTVLSKFRPALRQFVFHIQKTGNDPSNLRAVWRTELLWAEKQWSMLKDGNTTDYYLSKATAILDRVEFDEKNISLIKSARLAIDQFITAASAARKATQNLKKIQDHTQDLARESDYAKLPPEVASALREVWDPDRRDEFDSLFEQVEKERDRSIIQLVGTPDIDIVRTRKEINKTVRLTTFLRHAKMLVIGIVILVIAWDIIFDQIKELVGHASLSISDKTWVRWIAWMIVIILAFLTHRFLESKLHAKLARDARDHAFVLVRQITMIRISEDLKFFNLSNEIRSARGRLSDVINRLTALEEIPDQFWDLLVMSRSGSGANGTHR